MLRLHLTARTWSRLRSRRQNSDRARFWSENIGLEGLVSLNIINGSNQTGAYRPPRSRSRALVRLVDHGRGAAVLNVAGLPAPAHPSRSVQRLVDGLLVTVVGVFVAAVLTAVTLARRRRRAVGDHYTAADEGAEDCVELGELVTELDDSSPDDVDVPRSPPADWSVDDEDGREDNGKFDSTHELN